MLSIGLLELTLELPIPLCWPRWLPPISTSTTALISCRAICLLLPCPILLCALAPLETCVETLARLCADVHHLELACAQELARRTLARSLVLARPTTDALEPVSHAPIATHAHPTLAI